MLRLSKTVLVAALAFFFGLVVLNNVLDYNSNLVFVQHVLSMDTTFPGNKIMWRAMTAPWIHLCFYAGIVLWESIVCGLLGLGARKLWQARNAGPDDFNRAKSLAIAGLTASELLWLVAFLSVGGEWFAMWQSQTWNGQTAAARMFEVTGFILIFVAMKD
jgi:predicted small integral membrane protein